MIEILILAAIAAAAYIIARTPRGRRLRRVKLTLMALAFPALALFTTSGTAEVVSSPEETAEATSSDDALPADATPEIVEPDEFMGSCYCTFSGKF